mgnify:CR=1 FL=1
MMPEIGQLERVSLREVWPHEANDFTPWLQDNIEVLDELVGLGLATPERESRAGSFAADLVAEDKHGRKVIIENQLARSDHSHLGQILTYLVALDASAAVWIVSDPRPEHVAAIAWLNDSSSADFYLVKVEAVRIASSPPAPLLTLIVGPSEESASISEINREFKDTMDIRERWWKQLLARPDAGIHKHLNTTAYHWIGVTSGMSGVSYNYVIRQNDSTVELYIEELYAKRDTIEETFGEELTWQPLEGKRACRIKCEIDGGYRSPDDEWEDIQTKQVNAMNRLVTALSPHIDAIRRRSA